MIAVSDPIIPTGWFEGLVGVIMAGLAGWIGRLEFKANRNDDKLTDMQLDLAKNYNTKAELKETLREALDPVNRYLEKLERKLDELHDK